jgi:predicted dithiol-disulfide oxidoreductase (DUF899 family)
VSSEGGDFNLDFAFLRDGFNFGSAGGADVDVVHDAELMALSAFALEDGVVYHAYSCYDRGTDVLNPTWQLLDRAPKGREHGAVEGWPRRHDEYDDISAVGGETRV